MTSISRIRQRKLAQWGLAYLAGAWVLLQVLGFVAQSFAWSPQVARVATVLAIAGFLVVLVLAWYHGDQGRQHVSAVEIVVLTIVILAGGSAAWVLRGPRAAAAVALPAVTETREQNSIAVLPFVDLSAGKDQEYFSDGVSEEILNALARIPGLRVAARTSSFSFRNKDVQVAEVGRQLRVSNVLEGSVRRVGNRVRITTQLINASNGFQVWSESFDRDLQDIFAVQQEISQAIASKLRLQFSVPEPAAAEGTSQTAYDQYLRGRFFFNKRTPDGLRRAEEYFKRAIGTDPNFAPAHSGLAGTLLVLPLYADVDVSKLRPRVRAAVTRALQLDSTLADGWAGLAYIRMSYDHDWQGAASAFERSLRLNPSDPNTRTWYGDFLSAQQQLKPAIAQYERATQLDPLSALRRISLGWMLSADHRLEEAERELQLATELDPALVDGRTHLARIRFFQGKREQGIAELERVVELSERRTVELGYLGYAYGIAGRRADAEKLLQELESRGTSTSTPTAMAFVYVGLGDYDRAFDALELARRAGDMWLTENNMDLIFDPLRRDPRWKKLLSRMRIPVGDS